MNNVDYHLLGTLSYIVYAVFLVLALGIYYWFKR